MDIGFDGVRVQVPDGWDAFSRVEGGGIPVAHIANFPLAHQDDMPAEVAQRQLVPGRILNALRVFELGTHLLRVGVAFGDANPAWSSIATANKVLGTLSAN